MTPTETSTLTMTPTVTPTASMTPNFYYVVTLPASGQAGAVIHTWDGGETAIFLALLVLIVFAGFQMFVVMRMKR